VGALLLLLLQPGIGCRCARIYVFGGYQA
ncbi:hypothetical protein KIPB_009550, partial [Kipferlia bialata]